MSEAVQVAFITGAFTFAGVVITGIVSIIISSKNNKKRFEDIENRLNKIDESIKLLISANGITNKQSKKEAKKKLAAMGNFKTQKQRIMVPKENYKKTLEEIMSNIDK